jgi:hypothetical protein
MRAYPDRMPRITRQGDAFIEFTGPASGSRRIVLSGKLPRALGKAALGRARVAVSRCPTRGAPPGTPPWTPLSALSPRSPWALRLWLTPPPPAPGSVHRSQARANVPREWELPLGLASVVLLATSRAVTSLRISPGHIGRLSDRESAAARRHVARGEKHVIMRSTSVCLTSLKTGRSTDVTEGI